MPNRRGSGIHLSIRQMLSGTTLRAIERGGEPYRRYRTWANEILPTTPGLDLFDLKHQCVSPTRSLTYAVITFFISFLVLVVFFRSSHGRPAQITAASLITHLSLAIFTPRPPCQDRTRYIPSDVLITIEQ
ncbi:hypothetical protein H9L39_06706 [Fusarium oxysporum f. sp. albedinis]|nr:hypothetical protein H9L39_06706 [Fusarium oxysporum f. sp. albedinis]